MKKILIEKLQSKKAVVAILGLGYVGLPLALRFCEGGFKVFGIDVDKKKISTLKNSESYIDHIPATRISEQLNVNFTPTLDFSVCKTADAIIICVPTPLGKHREPDLSHIIKTADKLKPYVRDGQIISLESTTYPGTTEDELVPRLQTAELIPGKNIFVVYSPEREDPGNKVYSTQTIPKVVGGFSKDCLEVGKSLYESVIDRVVTVSSTQAAEMTKLLENIHRSVNIGLVNELKIVCDKMGIDIFEIVKAASTKPFGFTPYFPGPGLGGHCIPIDPHYLTWKAKEYDLHTRFIELAGEINSNMPHWVVSKMSNALNSVGKSVSGSKVLVLGISYKKDVGDVRESPSITIIEMLKKMGADVKYSDPFFPQFPSLDGLNLKLESVALTGEKLKEFDLALLATDHSAFDCEMLQRNSKLIVDTRGVLQRNLKNVIPA